MDGLYDARRQSLFDLPDFEEQSQLMDFPLPESPRYSGVAEPVAHVLVDAPGSHWNPVFDYAIPADMDAKAVVGCRVRVPYQHTRVDGFIIGRSAGSAYMPHIRPIESVVSSFPALSPQILKLCMRIADRQAAPLMQVIKTAIPPRHARAEKAVIALPEPQWPTYDTPQAELWSHYGGGTELIHALSCGERVRAGCTLAPHDSSADLLTVAVHAVLHQGKSVLIITPTPREAFALADCFRETIPEPVSVLTADLPHEDRYRAFVGAALGRVRVLIGTRSAALVPMRHCALVVVIDSAHSAHRDKRSPYLHSFDMLKERSDIEKCSFLSLDRGPHMRMRALEEQGWAQPRIRVLPQYKRELSAQIILAQDMSYEGAPWARLPDSVFTSIRSGLDRGNVLVMVPRSGYIPLMSCARCLIWAHCPECHGRLQIPAPDMPAQCSRCGYIAHHYTCPECGFHALRPRTLGSVRTAQEIGRAFPGVSIVIAREPHHEYAEIRSQDSRREGGVPACAPAPNVRAKRAAIIVATPADQLWYGEKYASAVILDAGFALHSAGLASEEYMLRLIGTVAHYVRPRGEGGQLLIVGDIPRPLSNSDNADTNVDCVRGSFDKSCELDQGGDLISALRTLDWQDWEKHTLAERHQLHLPPAYAWVACEGQWAKIREFLSIIRGIDMKQHSQSTTPSAYSVLHHRTQPDMTDAFLLGGIHQITENISAIGPTQQADGSVLCYLRSPESNRDALAALVRRALQELYSKDRTYLRVKVDPTL